MRTLLMVVGFCIVVFAGAWMIASMMEVAEKPAAAQQRQTVIMPPQTVVVNDYESQIKSLQTEVSSLKDDLSTAKQQYQREYQMQYTYYTQDYLDRHSDTNDEFDLTVVVKDEDGDPIENAEVRITDDVTKTRDTDEDGEARFSNLDEDCYDIRVKMSGYGTEEDSICLEDDERVTIRLE